MVPVASESLSNETNEQRPRKRVRMACNRCRRQKLKCDTKRPCALCSRSAVDCITDSRDLPWHKDQDRDSAIDSSGSHATVSSRTDRRLHEALLPNLWLSERPWQQPSFHETSHLDKNTAVPWNYPRDTSAVKLTQEQLSPDTSLDTDTSALPGGSGNNITPCPDTVPINQILGLNLPSKVVSDDLFNAYFDSVHWFMVLFHEPSFRERYNAIMLTGQATPEDLPFLACLMLVLAIGARYINRKSNLSPEVADTNLDILQSNLLKSTRVHLLDIVELGGVEGVQICVLLSTFYLYHDRPNLAFAVHGMGVKCAHTMCLHQEAAWKEPTTLTREVKRRVWWAFFYSIIFGRPRSIRDEESHVAMVQNLEDTAARHPAFNSTESVGESSYPVTTFSYQRYKFILYTIAARVMRDIYFENSSTSLISVSHTIRSICRDLESWFQSLPPELKHPGDNISEFVIQQDQDPVTINTVRIFRLQAMALQLAYDNIQILLHRPLLQLPLGMCSPPQAVHGMRRMDASNVKGKTGNKSNPCAIDSATLALSKTQCYKSAVRTACLNASIVEEARHTHAASYIGIQLFTAGMVLSIVALSAPLSSEAQQAKRAIGRIVSTTASIGNKSLLSTQSQQILRRLVRLVLEKEMNSIFVEPVAQPGTLNIEKPTLQNPSRPVPSKSVPVPNQGEGYKFGSASQTGIATYDPDGNGPMAQPSEVSTAIQQDEFVQGTWDDLLSTEDFSYNQAMSSIQQGLAQPRHPQDVGSDWSSFPATSSMLTESLELSDESARPFLVAAPENGFQGAGQAWLWEDGLLQPVNPDS
ncbi:fungal-specific transcription factor domain-containing protein [Fusarium tricinctum]|uniref:Fungal-specific transcription factor domain-containing protein n=1 Tax=Fusarium tricinctum TaxID=61284 RepID=A0A8K0S775_9HYPO|nr:fungal-specific transcription factor domain-containing protein [Fusarium tricinctum]